MKTPNVHTRAQHGENYYSRARFFRDHAGSSYAPDRETLAQGTWRGALNLASAELRGERIGLSFNWEIDPDIDSDSFSDEKPAWSLWVCDCIGPDGQCSLGGIDFGRDGSPHGESYARVVQAELACEYFSERAR